MSLPIPAAEALPWQARTWSRLARQMSQDRLPAGLLFAGAPGVGKRALALRFVAALLCADRSRTGDACGACGPCQQRQAGSHPDLIIGEPEPDKKQLSVDVVREFSRRMFLTSSMPSGRLGLMLQADRMNTHAANALLKTLEEPPPTAHIVLVCDQLAVLPATIRSRCQLIRVGIEQPDAVRSWLAQQQQGLPESEMQWYVQRPMQLLQSDVEVTERQQWREGLQAVWSGQIEPLAAAAAIEESRVDQWVQFAHQLGADVLRDSLGQGGGRWVSAASAGNPAASQAIRRLLDGIRAALLMARGQANRRLMLEVLMLEWSRAGRLSRRSAKA